MSQKRRRHVENVVGTDTGLEDVGTNVCCSAGYAAKWVSGASSVANEREMASDLSRRAGVAQCHLSKLTGKVIEED